MDRWDDTYYRFTYPFVLDLTHVDCRGNVNIEIRTTVRPQSLSMTSSVRMFILLRTL